MLAIKENGQLKGVSFGMKVETNSIEFKLDITPNPETPLSTENMTIYTPNAEFTKFFIRQNSSGFNVCWCKQFISRETTGSVSKLTVSTTIRYANGNAVEPIAPDKAIIPIQSTRKIETNAQVSGVNFYVYKSTTNYSTLEEAILAIQNSQTQYTYITSGAFSNTLTTLITNVDKILPPGNVNNYTTYTSLPTQALTSGTLTIEVQQ